jgi:hypothetical protein
MKTHCLQLRYATERVGVYKSKSIGTIHKDEMKTHGKHPTLTLFKCKTDALFHRNPI